MSIDDKAFAKMYESSKLTHQPDDSPNSRKFYPEASKAYEKWVKTAGDNPIIMADASFETYLAGWQAHEKANKRESSDEPMVRHLAILVRRLCYWLSKHGGRDGETRAAACMDFLIQHDLQGSPLGDSDNEGGK